MKYQGLTIFGVIFALIDLFIIYPILLIKYPSQANLIDGIIFVAGMIFAYLFIFPKGSKPWWLK